MSQDQAGRAHEFGTTGLPSRQGDHPDRRIGQSDTRLDGRPAEDRRALQAEEDQDAAEEALDAGPLAQLLGSPSRREAVPLLLALGIPRNDRSGAQRGMDPGNQLEAPVGSVQPDDARTHREQADGQFE